MNEKSSSIRLWGKGVIKGKIRESHRKHYQGSTQGIASIYSLEKKSNFNGIVQVLHAERVV